MNEHTCLVCGYSDDLEFHPADYQICASCGTEFGLSDRVLTHEQLRAMWIAEGYPWFDEGFGPPADWNPVQQLERLAAPHPEKAEDASEAEYQTHLPWCKARHTGRRPRPKR